MRPRQFSYPVDTTTVQKFSGLVNQIMLKANTTSTLTTLGQTSPTLAGTISHPVPTAASAANSTKRWRVTSAAAINSLAEQRYSTTGMPLFRGDANGLGGFIYTTRFSLSAMNASSRGFFGMATTTGSFGSAAISTLNNLIGMGFDQGDTTWSIYYNDGSGNASKINLGAGYPVDITTLYDFVLECPSNSTDVTYRVYNKTTKAAPSVGVLTTDLPATTAMMGVRAQLDTNLEATAVSYDCTFIYQELAL